ncbi:MAG: DegT/DnrJ/EryC1/StrS family aminotransferase [Chloroflexi bacterium]|nr:DegT/DnrJ/EryC1/StrS family aminotransferase [Chloroflexota bacterium]
MSHHKLRRTVSMLLASRLLCDLTGRQYAVLTGRAAAGIWALLRVLGFQDRWVLIPANTCYIVLWAVLRSGNKPFLVDIDPQTGNITAAALSGSLPDQPAAIIPCHMYGLSAPTAALCAWARARGIFVIEDATLAVGAQADGQPAGAWGGASIFSFGQGKLVDNNVGGAVLTDDQRLAAEVERFLAGLPVWGDHLADLTDQWNQIYWALHQHEAENPQLLRLYPLLFEMFQDLTGYQLPPASWVNLPEALQNLPANLQRRAQMAALYDRMAADIPVETLNRPAGSVLWRYPLLVPVEHRNGLLQHLWQNNLREVTRWYPPLRYMRAALAPHLPPQATPRADQLGASIINLPVHAGRAVVVRTIHTICRYFA